MCYTPDKKDYIERAKLGGHNFVVVVCDTFSGEYYPVFVKQESELADYQRKYSINMQRVDEIIDVRPYTSQVTPNDTHEHKEITIDAETWLELGLAQGFSLPKLRSHKDVMSFSVQTPQNYASFMSNNLLKTFYPFCKGDGFQKDMERYKRLVKLIGIVE